MKEKGEENLVFRLLPRGPLEKAKKKNKYIPYTFFNVYMYTSLYQYHAINTIGKLLFGYRIVRDEGGGIDKRGGNFFLLHIVEWKRKRKGKILCDISY